MLEGDVVEEGAEVDLLRGEGEEMRREDGVVLRVVRR